MLFVAVQVHFTPRSGSTMGTTTEGFQAPGFRVRSSSLTATTGDGLLLQLGRRGSTYHTLVIMLEACGLSVRVCVRLCICMVSSL